MRLDRFITLNLVQPFRRTFVCFGIHGARPAAFGDALPVLMYHSISDDLEPGVRPYYRVCTSPKRFREQMRWLKDNGYRGVTLGDGLAWLKASSAPSLARRVAITFDDGFRDFYTTAWPVLQEFGFAATMYLPTAFIGFCPDQTSPQTSTSTPSGRIAFKSRECLTWQEVQELHHAGIEFGSHTVNHPELVKLPWSEARLEIQNSKLEIEKHLGVPCTTFAYPYAFPQARRNFVEQFKESLTADGYQTCVTTQIGWHRADADPMEIKRLPVNSDDDDRLFQAKLEGSYDWLALPQRMIKKFKKSVLGSMNVNKKAGRLARSGEPALNH